MKYDLAVIADLCVDILITGEEEPEFGQVEKFVDDYYFGLGGSAVIFASQFRKLGGNPAFFALIGHDEFGDLLNIKLNALNINTEYVYQEIGCKTPVGLGLIKGHDRAMLTYKGSMENINIERVAESGILSKVNHIHICGFYLLDHLKNQWAPHLKIFKEAGGTISLDTNWAPEGNWKDVSEILPLVDVFIPNEEEAKKISGKATYQEAGMWLNQFCKIVVIKRGAQGATVYQSSIKTDYGISESVTANLDIKDTTGAGDNFSAGFVHSWLKKRTIVECVNIATKCATMSLSKLGGIDGQWIPEDRKLEPLTFVNDKNRS